MKLTEALKKKDFTMYSFAKENSMSNLTLLRLNHNLSKPSVGTLEILHQYGIIKDLSKINQAEYLIEE